MKEYRPSGCTLDGDDCQYNEDADNAVDIVQKYVSLIIVIASSNNSNS